MFKTVKNFLFIVSGSLLRLVLFAGITTTVLLIIFGSSATLKATLQSTNAYNRFVPSLIEANKKNNQQAGNLSLEDPKIAEILTNSFPAADLKNSTETFIDSVYSWLTKKSPSLSFSIDFTKNKQQFSRELADYAFNKLERLPLCKQAPAELDPLNATCRPKNFSIEDAKHAYELQIFTSDTFLQKTILTQEDLPKNAAGQTIASQLHYAPTVFTWLKRAPYILGALLLFLVIDFILLSPRRRKGIKNLSTILISSGVSIIIFPILFSYVIPYFSKSFQFDFESVGTQKIFSEIIDQLSRNIDILFIAIGGAIALLGLVLYVGERITRPTTKYTNLEKRSGLAVSTKKQEQSPKSLRGKLNQDNIPLQTSDGPKNKKQKGKSKYRTIMNKKEF